MRNPKIIGNQAFFGCDKLRKVNIPNGVTNIGYRIFGYCYELWSVNIPNSVTNINQAFIACGSLKNITIPSSVKSFTNSPICITLSSITVDSGNTVYDSRNNCNAIIETSTNTLIQGCKNTVIPNSVTSIGNSAFNGCSSLTSIDIPSSVTSIGEQAFRRCSGLTSVTVNAVAPPTLGSYAFLDTNNCPIYVPNESVEDYKAATNWKSYASRIQAIPQ